MMMPYHGPLERRESFHSSLYGGSASAATAAAAVTRPSGFQQRSRRMQRGIVEWVVRTVEFRNKFPLLFRLPNHRSSSFRSKDGHDTALYYGNINSNSFVDLNSSTNRRAREKSSGWGVVGNNNANRKSRTRLLFRPIVNWLDRSNSSSSSNKVAMETMDAMDVMAGDMSEMEYSRAMTVLSSSPMDDSLTSSSIKVRPDKSKKRRWNNLFRVNLFKDKTLESSAMMSRGGAIATTTAIAAAAAPSSTFKSSAKKSSSSISTTSTTKFESTILSSPTDTWVIETPLFPIILPKSWEPPTTTTTTSLSSTAQARTSTEVLEISVALEQQQQETTLSKPSLTTLQTATQPLIPKEAWATFQGNEMYHPESMEMLSQTGLRMALGSSTIIDWIGEKKTDKFLKDYDGSSSLVEALMSSKEVLAWSGKFTSEGHGSELPLIKTMAVIDKSPEYLADLLMDSSKVKVYNKMSLGRSDEEVFQSGM